LLEQKVYEVIAAMHEQFKMLEYQCGLSCRSHSSEFFEMLDKKEKLLLQAIACLEKVLSWL